MKIAFLSFVMLTLGYTSVSQQKPAPLLSSYNACFMELGGPGLIGAVGYERTWYHNDIISVVTSLGGFYWPGPSGVLNINIEPDVLIFLGRSAMELGLAYSVFRYPDSTPAAATKYEQFLVPRMGYRYFLKKERVFLKCGITPRLDITHRPYKDTRQYANETFSHLWFNIIGLGIKF